MPIDKTTEDRELHNEHEYAEICEHVNTGLQSTEVTIVERNHHDNEKQDTSSDRSEEKEDMNCDYENQTIFSVPRNTSHFPPEKNADGMSRENTLYENQNIELRDGDDEHMTKMGAAIKGTSDSPTYENAYEMTTYAEERRMAGPVITEYARLRYKGKNDY